MARISNAKSGIYNTDVKKFDSIEDYWSLTRSKKKSGKSLINEHVRLSKKESLQIRTPYVPNGFNKNTLLFEPSFNDEHVIFFDITNSDDPNFDAVYISSNVTTDFIASEYNFGENRWKIRYPNNNKNEINSELLTAPSLTYTQQNSRINIKQQIATPSTLPDLNYIFNNTSRSINENFITKGNAVETKFIAFKDREYLENSANNLDFIKGNNEYGFLNTDLFEEVSIDIELDTPVNTILQNAAYVQKENKGFEDTVNKNTYSFTDINSSPFDIRIDSPKNLPRTNTPFIIYNFDKKCWEYRGMPMPYYQINKSSTTKFDTLSDITIAPNPNPSATIKIQPDVLIESYDDVTNQPDIYNWTNFSQYFSKYFLHQLPITNSPIINPRIYDGVLNPNATGYSGISLPTSQFGFPMEKKFHAFEDNLLDLNQFINTSFVIDRISCNLDLEVLSEISNINNTKTNILHDGFTGAINFYLIKQDKQPDEISNTQNKYDFLKYSKTFRSYQKPLINFPNSNKVYRVFADENFQYTEMKLIGNKNSPDYSMDDFLYEVENNQKAKRSIITFGNIIFNNTEDNGNFSSILQQNADKLIITDDRNENGINTSDFSGRVNVITYIKKPNFDNSIFTSHILNNQIELPVGLNYYDISSSTRDFLNNLNGRDFINSVGRNNNLLKDQDKIDESFDPFVYVKNSLLDPRVNTQELPNDNPNLLFYNNNNEYPDEKLTKFVSNYKIDKQSNYSPYVLLPTDKISFCFSISPLIISELIKQQYVIKKGKVKFTLHGYKPKNRQLTHETTNAINGNQKNIITQVIGNTDIVDDYQSATYLNSFIKNFYDRLFTGTFNENDTSRQLDNLDPTTSYSKILSGKSFTKFVALRSNFNLSNTLPWLYDNDEVLMAILKPLLSTDNQVNIKKYLNSYRGSTDGNGNVDTSLDIGKIEYFDFNIAAATGFYKTDIKNLSDLFTGDAIYQELLESGPIGIILAGLYAISKLASGGNLNKKYSLPAYFSLNKYGQLTDLLQQRLYTTEMVRDVNGIAVISHVIEQKFINPDTGVEITDLNNELLPRNKSKNITLLGTGKSISQNGVIVPWEVDDFFKLKHIAFNDNNVEIFN